MKTGKISIKLLVCLAFGILGFMGNWFRLELFYNQDFLFGSIFVMFAIMRVGAGCGVLAGFVAGTCTYFLWNHPWAIVVTTCEALFVASFYSRKKGNLVIYDIAYWMLIGMPLVYIFYHLVLGIQLQSTLFIMLKQFVNGVFNALIAFTVSILLRLNRNYHGERIPYSHLIFVMMVSLVLMPALLFFIIGVRAYPEKEKEAFSARLSHTTEMVRSGLSDWIEDHRQNVHTLAALVGDPALTPFEDMQRYVETVKAATPACEMLGVVNENSVTVAFSPPEDENGRSTLGVDFSDRPHVSFMKENRKPYVSNLFMGRLGNPSPTLLFLSPILIAGEYKGYCTGVLKISLLADFLTNVAGRDNVNITLVDGNGKVIAGNLRGLKIMDPLLRPYTGAKDSGESEIIHWIPDSQPGSHIFQRWGESLLIKTAYLSTDYGWKVVVEASFLPVFEQILGYGINALVLLSVLTFTTVILSHLFSRGVVASIVELQDNTRHFPEQIEKAAEVSWPESKIRELSALSTNFRDMALALSASFRKQSELNATLEHRVNIRTEELRREVEDHRKSDEARKESEERFRKVFEEGPLGMAIINLDYRFSKVNSKFREMLGYAENEFSLLNFPDVTKLGDTSGEDNVLNRLLKDEIPFLDIENHYTTRTGELIWAHSTLSVIRNNMGEALYGLVIVENITRRKQIERELDEYREHLEVLVRNRTRELAVVNEQLRLEIAQRKIVEEALRKGQKQLHAFAAKLSESEEIEKHRLALELHDRVGQNLSAISINLNILRNLLPIGSAAACYDRIRDSLALVRETFKSIRDLMADLRPPVLDDYGLPAALRWYADQFRERTGIETTVQIERLSTRLPLHAETALFRISQEALSNIARHSHATSVVISLMELKHRFRMTVRDNGVGFDPEIEYNYDREPRWGLMGMRERAEGVGGKLKIKSEPGKGTLVVVTT